MIFFGTFIPSYSNKSNSDHFSLFPLVCLLQPYLEYRVARNRWLTPQLITHSTSIHNFCHNSIFVTKPVNLLEMKSKNKMCKFFWNFIFLDKLLFFDQSKKNSRMWNEICQKWIFKSVRRMLCKRSKLQPARVPAPETSYEEYVKMSKKSRIVNRQKAHGKFNF